MAKLRGLMPSFVLLIAVCFSMKSIACERIVAPKPTCTQVTSTQQKPESFPAYFSPQDDLQQKLIQLINAEKKSLKIANYRLNDFSIIAALSNALNRGVSVHLIVNKANKNELDKLPQIKTLTRTFSGQFSYNTCKLPDISLMHHKFVIFEQNRDNKPLAWIGSYNFANYSGFKQNHDSVVLISNPSMINQFKHQFNILQGAQVAPLLSCSTVSNTGIREVFFSPLGGSKDALLRLINGENKSIKICMDEFTDNDIVNALTNASKSGCVPVQIIVSKIEHDRSTAPALNDNQIEALQKAGIEVNEYKPVNGELMHNKFALFGNNGAIIRNQELGGKSVVWAGSYNFTTAAEKDNCESTVLIDDSSLVKKFDAQFELVKKHSQTAIAQPFKCNVRPAPKEITGVPDLKRQKTS